jgi:hypothetical protein
MLPGDKRILIISEAHLIKTFVAETLMNIRNETGVVFDGLITTPPSDALRREMFDIFDNVYINEYPRGIIGRIPKIRVIQSIYGLRKLASSLPQYDIIHIHFLHYIFAFFISILREKTKRLYLTFYGGDFHKISEIQHRFNRKTVDRLDGVFAINKVMLQNIIAKYDVDQMKKSCEVVKLLMHNLEKIGPFLEKNTIESAKKMWNFEKTVIVCAYSAGTVMQHEKIINALDKISNQLEQSKIVFPMTYGSGGNVTRATVRARLEKSSLDSLVLDKFLSVEMLNALRLSADIFIVIPSRDQMASSLLEHLAAGSVVITGKWLPYESLSEMGAYYITIERPEDLSLALTEVIANLDQHKRKSLVNKDLVLNMMSWKTIRPNWYKYYGLQQKHERI